MSTLSLSVVPRALIMDTPIRVPTEDRGTLETMHTGMSTGFWNADTSADRREGEDLGTYLYSSKQTQLADFPESSSSQEL